MWQCDDCSYYNDKWDESCAKCGAAKPPGQPAVIQQVPAGDATVVNAQSPDSTVQTRAVAQKAKPFDPTANASSTSGDGSKAVDRVLAIVITLIGLAIVAAALTAWQLGLLDGSNTKVQGSSADSTVEALSGAEFGVAAADLESIPAKHRRRFSGFLQDIASIRNDVSSLQPESDRDGVLSEGDLQGLADLDASAIRLKESYKAFEQAIADSGDPGLADFALLGRQQYQLAHNEVFEGLRAFRGADLGEMQRAYLLSDELTAAADQWGHLDTAALKEIWMLALYDKRQLELDLEYGEYYQQLEARIDALVQIHQEFNLALQEVAPYNIRSGTLGQAARSHLDALDSYAGLVERMTLEFEEYKGQLEGLEQSEKMKELFGSFESLAQQDHLHCFSEVYIVYVQDKELDHPAYEALAGHFEFVKETWPSLELTYQGIARQYEMDWIRIWRPDVLED